MLGRKRVQDVVGWWRFTVMYLVHVRVQEVQIKLAARVPGWLAKWVVIRAANRAAGDHRNPTTMTVMDLLDIFEPDPEARRSGLDFEELMRAAIELWDNRVGWGDGRPPFASREFWGRLGAALGHEDDELVQEYRGAVAATRGLTRTFGVDAGWEFGEGWAAYDPKCTPDDRGAPGDPRA